MTESRRPRIAVLIAITMSGTVSLNIILPSLPSMQKSLNTTPGMVSLTLSLFLVALAVGQLLYGPLSDRFGRRPMVLGGLIILLSGTLICWLAPTIEVLIVGRLVQAIGGCAGMVMGRAMVRDIYDTDKAASMIAYLTMAAVVVPTLSPLIGGYLDVWYGWRAAFVFVLAFALAILTAALLFAHETLPAERRHEVRLVGLFGAFNQLLRNPIFCGYAFQVSFNTAAYFAFIGGSAGFIVNLMGRSPVEMGYYFVPVSVTYILGNFGVARLAQKQGVARMVGVGTAIAMTGTLIMLAIELSVGLDHISFTAIICLVALGNGFSISSGTAGAIGADSSRIGAASGLVGSMQIGISAISVHFGGALISHSVRPLIWIIVGCTFLALVAAHLGRFVEARQASRTPI